MDRKSRNKNEFILDKHKLKVINQYKKLKRKEEEHKTIGFKHQKKQKKFDKKPMFEKKIKKDSMSVAISKGEQLKQEKEQHKLDKQRRELDRLEKLKKRRKTHRKLTAKTPKGQPLMRNRMQFLLEKIQNNKELYCPGKS